MGVIWGSSITALLRTACRGGGADVAPESAGFQGTPRAAGDAVDATRTPRAAPCPPLLAGEPWRQWAAGVRTRAHLKMSYPTMPMTSPPGGPPLTSPSSGMVIMTGDAMCSGPSDQLRALTNWAGICGSGTHRGRGDKLQGVDAQPTSMKPALSLARRVGCRTASGAAAACWLRSARCGRPPHCAPSLARTLPAMPAAKSSPNVSRPSATTASGVMTNPLAPAHATRRTSHAGRAAVVLIMCGAGDAVALVPHEPVRQQVVAEASHPCLPPCSRPPCR